MLAAFATPAAPLISVPCARAPASRRPSPPCTFRPRACASPPPSVQETQPPAPTAPWANPDWKVAPVDQFGSSGVPVSDAMEFFHAREGDWSSWRVTHHLAFRRAESGASDISMICLEKDDERILQLLDDNGIDRAAAQGGCYVTWKATLDWDQEGENHEGSTVFALVPDVDDKRRGRIIRDRGYAEVVPIAGRYYIDKEDALCLDTPYEGGTVEERFCFDGPDMLHRVSTVRRFGGLSNATFALETRKKVDTEAGTLTEQDFELTDDEEEAIMSGRIFLLGGRAYAEEKGGGGSTSTASQSSFVGGSRARMAAAAAAAARSSSPSRPSPGSAFGSAFSNSVATPQPPAAEKPVQAAKSEAEIRAGIDLSKVPPSMRADFMRSMGLKESADDS
jgi:hypothetical protein